MSTENRLLTVNEASKILRISVPTLYAWAKQRRIPHIRLGDRVLFNPVEIIAAATVPIAEDFAQENVCSGNRGSEKHS